MAVFLVNNCAFQGCGLTFSTLADLIQHIEDTHIDTDPRSLELQEEDKPLSLPLSYILRFYTEADKREQYDIQKKRLRAHSPAVSLPESTPTESEVDEESIKSDNDDSDDSWTTQEDFPSDVILNMMGGRERDMEGDRPYGCPVPGCKKRYKNVNGIKYHARHGHKNEASKILPRTTREAESSVEHLAKMAASRSVKREECLQQPAMFSRKRSQVQLRAGCPPAVFDAVKKSYRCFCGKSYRSVQGLRNHTSLQHPATEFTAPTPPPITMVTTVMSPPVPPNVNVSSPTLPSAKDSSSSSIAEQLSLHASALPITPRLATLTPSRLLSHKVAAQVKSVAMAAAAKGQGSSPTALALPIGTPVQFISQPASVVPVPVAVKSIKP